MQNFREDDEVKANRKRAILDAMPVALYQSLPSADLTAELCSTMISRALRARNPRLVRQWLGYERSRATDADLLASFELALSIEVAGTSALRDLDMLAMIRTELRGCFAEPAAGAETDAVPPLVGGLLLGIAAFDRRVHDHSLSVAKMAARLAAAAKLPEDRVTHVVQAACVHELGRLHIDRSLLNSPDVFDTTERDAIREQLADVRALEEHSATRELGTTIYGLYLADSATATEEVRLLRVVDAFVSLCEMRPCRPALSPHEALDRLWTQRGARFDSAYVELLAQVLGYQRRYARSA
jgi:HD-GYP domain-containing protein (c-di-GMP phosphodiesterase class II)